MNYKHPLEIPKSDTITGFAWTAERTPCPIAGMHGDTHPMTWADDDRIYMSAGDPNWIMENGKPRHMPWTDAFDKPDIYPHMGGVDVEELTGYGADFGVRQINSMIITTHPIILFSILEMLCIHLLFFRLANLSGM
jgi:hypothetical protein